MTKHLSAYHVPGIVLSALYVLTYVNLLWVIFFSICTFLLRKLSKVDPLTTWGLDFHTVKNLHITHSWPFVYVLRFFCSTNSRWGNSVVFNTESNCIKVHQPSSNSYYSRVTHTCISMGSNSTCLLSSSVKRRRWCTWHVELLGDT